jgi:hypothetical protein
MPTPTPSLRVPFCNQAPSSPSARPRTPLRPVNQNVPPSPSSSPLSHSTQERQSLLHRFQRSPQRPRDSHHRSRSAAPPDDLMDEDDNPFRSRGE